MNKCQYLLVKLAEECSEIAQMALKTSQFGMDEVMPGQPFNNAERLHMELDDLQGVLKMLNEEHSLGYIPSKEKMNAKVEKIRKYMKYSSEIGAVTIP